VVSSGIPRTSPRGTPCAPGRPSASHTSDMGVCLRGPIRGSQ
jgi:hypothetical protein